jgi:hypothetical protein
VDTVRLAALQRHFYTADVALAKYGRVMLVGDQEAVERVLTVLGEHVNHELKLLPPEPPPAGDAAA